MLALCRALVGEPAVVLFDELSMGLAPLVVGRALRAGRRAARRRAARSCSSSSTSPTPSSCADLCYVLAKGEVAWQGEPQELQASDEASRLLSATG